MNSPRTPITIQPVTTGRGSQRSLPVHIPEQGDGLLGVRRYATWEEWAAENEDNRLIFTVLCIYRYAWRIFFSFFRHGGLTGVAGLRINIVVAVTPVTFRGFGRGNS